MDETFNVLLNSLGRKHVKRYWQRREHLADSTKRDHHYAIEYVWCDLLGENRLMIGN